MVFRSLWPVCGQAEASVRFVLALLRSAEDAHPVEHLSTRSLWARMVVIVRVVVGHALTWARGELLAARLLLATGTELGLSVTTGAYRTATRARRARSSTRYRAFGAIVIADRLPQLVTEWIAALMWSATDRFRSLHICATLGTRSAGHRRAHARTVHAGARAVANDAASTAVLGIGT